MIAKPYITYSGMIWVCNDKDKYSVDFSKSEAEKAVLNGGAKYAEIKHPNWLPELGIISLGVEENNAIVLTGVNGLLKQYLPLSAFNEFQFFILVNKKTNDISLAVFDLTIPNSTVTFFNATTIENCLHEFIIFYDKSITLGLSTIKYGEKLKCWYFKMLFRLPKISINQIIK